jgi:hypothetical protein
MLDELGGSLSAVHALSKKKGELRYILTALPISSSSVSEAVLLDCQELRMALLPLFLFYALLLPWFTRGMAQIASSLITAGAIIGFTTTAGATATLLPDTIGYYWNTSTCELMASACVLIELC